MVCWLYLRIQSKPFSVLCGSLLACLTIAFSPSKATSQVPEGYNPIGDLNSVYVPGAVPNVDLTVSSPDLSPLAGTMNIDNSGGAGSSALLSNILALCAQALSGGLMTNTPTKTSATQSWADDLEAAARAPIERDHYRSAGGNTVVIDCDQNSMPQSKITIGYGSDSKCTKERMHEGMAEHMDKNFLQCVQHAAGVAGMEKPESIHINHMGCYSERMIAGTNTPSLHSHGRALDIGAIVFKPSGERVSMHVNQKRNNKVFYDQLRMCWARSLPENCRAGRSREAYGSIGYPGSTGPANNDHNDHLHLSYPPCAGG